MTSGSDGPDAGRRGDGAEIRMRPAELRDTHVRDWLIRFVFGAGVSALAAIIAKLAGPQIGGLFLAFPAILLASLTMIAKEDSPRQARNDARGATLGAAGLIAFAITGAITITRIPAWAALLAATGAWAVVGYGGYLIMRRAGAGGDD
jgi:uncharacterized membrane protein (GlpM family)